MPCVSAHNERAEGTGIFQCAKKARCRNVLNTQTCRHRAFTSKKKKKRKKVGPAIEVQIAERAERPGTQCVEEWH
eukprot:m.67685 g.67685  ORF g.67685 m.67685 type:complete len:75 (-) comp18226_c0_seq1:25-249(-)